MGRSVVFSMKLNPKSEWDREILRWLRSIPPRSRSTMVKYHLWRAITGRDAAASAPAAEGQKVDARVSRKLDDLKF